MTNVCHCLKENLLQPESNFENVPTREARQACIFLKCEEHLTNLYRAALSTSGECFAFSVDLPSVSVATPRASALDTRPRVLFKGGKKLHDWQMDGQRQTEATTQQWKNVPLS